LWTSSLVPPLCLASRERTPPSCWLYALGAYLGTYLTLKVLEVGLSLYLTYLMLLAGALIIGVITGSLIERLCLRRVYGQAEAIQLLLTFSILLILDDLIKLIWGTAPYASSEHAQDLDTRSALRFGQS
jgi:branched-chain amino acid transport system permease protein